MAIFYLHNYTADTIAELVPDSVVIQHSISYCKGFRHGIAYSLWLDLERAKSPSSPGSHQDEAFNLGWLDGRVHATKNNLDYRAHWRRLVEAASILGLSGSTHHLQFVGGAPALKMALQQLWLAELP